MSIKIQNNVGGLILHFTIFKVCNRNLSITATRRSSIERVEEIDKICNVSGLTEENNKQNK